MSANPWARALSQPPDGTPWRSVDELLSDPAALARLANEFPEGALDANGFSRRRFLTLMGAAAGLAGAACTRPTSETLLPYSRTNMAQPTPGTRLSFSTMMTLSGYAIPLLATSLDGRPIKLDGHPAHPATVGASSPFIQGALLDLYNPARLQSVTYQGHPSSWTAFRTAFASIRPPTDKQFAVLLEPTTSEQTESLLEQLHAVQPKLKVYFHSSLPNYAEQAFQALFHEPTEALPVFEHAHTIVSLGDDFLGVTPHMTRNSRGFAAARRSQAGARLYVVESSLTATGMTADLRHPVDSDSIPVVALQLLRAVATRVGQDAQGLVSHLPAWLMPAPEWVESIAQALVSTRGSSLVTAGAAQPPGVHGAVLGLNELLGNKRTLSYVTSPFRSALESGGTTNDFIKAARDGAIDAALILDVDPAYEFAELGSALKTVKSTACLSLYPTATTRVCDWVLPLTHPLESWSDGRSQDGTLTFGQPLIEPLFGGDSFHGVLASLAIPNTIRTARDRARDFWTPRLPDGMLWEEVVRNGMLKDSALPNREAEFDQEALLSLVGTLRRPQETLRFERRADSSLYDGRFTNNAWLQEMPDPVTKQTWGNAALISPGLAAAQSLTTGDLVRLESKSGSLEAPVLVLPGQAERTITLSVGYGQKPLGDSTFDALPSHTLGVNAFELEEGEIELQKLSKRVVLAITQEHWSIGKTSQSKTSSASTTPTPPPKKPTRKPKGTSLDAPLASGPQWGMTIDLDVCTGCSACVIACQSENNIATVGPENVIKSREMHWIRIDRYFSGPPNAPHVVNQPMLCQHCERAPCEYVCPVNATTHSPDGLNEMTYNRCVGTRFCSNNCPYKVRRFNWFDYHTHDSPLLSLGRNNEVTVRSRGVMEKCTFCVQRIRTAQIQAGVEKRPLKTDEVKTACQQACPTQAIVFGDITDPASAVARRLGDSRAYQELAELGTRPRVHYLRKRDGFPTEGE